ncbi:hypothetical protein BGX27_005367, partial [Mortierella sp. AM989]
MNTNCFDVDDGALDPTAKVILHYNGAPSSFQADSQDWGSRSWTGRCLDLTSGMLEPLVSFDAPIADVQFMLDMPFQTITKNCTSLGYVS